MLGSGTESSPYLIETIQDFYDMRDDVTAHYRLVNDIDFNGGSPTLIGGRFSGVLDGDGHVVKNTFFEGRGGQIFTNVRNGTIKNLGVVDGLRKNEIVADRGVLVTTTVDGNSLIENCYVDDFIIDGSTRYAGIASRTHDNAIIRNCYTNITIRGTQTAIPFARTLYGKSVVENCFSNSTHEGTGTKNGFIEKYFNDSDGINNYFNSDNIGKTYDAKATALTTLEMTQESSFEGFDFDEIWVMGAEYPLLRVFPIETVPNIEVVDVSSHVNNVTTDLDKFASKTHRSNSYINPVTSHHDRYTATFKTVETYTSKLYSDVTQSQRSVRTSTEQVDAFVRPFYSKVERKVRVDRLLNSYLNSIHTYTNIIIPIDDKVVNAYLSYFANQSTITSHSNKTNTSILVNPTSLEVID